MVMVLSIWKTKYKAIFFQGGRLNQKSNLKLWVNFGMFQGLSESVKPFKSYFGPNTLTEERKMLSNQTEAETFHLINGYHQSLCQSFLISLSVQCIYLEWVPFNGMSHEKKVWFVYFNYFITVWDHVNNSYN